MNRFGLTQAVLDQIENELRKFLAQKKHFAIFVFGSRATKKHKQYSDLDLWIESSPELSAQELSVLKQNFTDSDLPIKMDLLTPSTCLEEYRERILKERELWFEKS
jgi:type I restriction enzyme S subunit